MCVTLFLRLLKNILFLTRQKAKNELCESIRIASGFFMIKSLLIIVYIGLHKKYIKMF